MAKTNNDTPAVQGPKYAIVKSAFDLEAQRHNYETLLQSLSAVVVTPDNVTNDLAKDGREALKALEDKKDLEAKEPLQWHADVMTCFKSLKEPLKEQVDRIANDRKTVSAKIDADNAKQLAEQNRINTAKRGIIEFTNKVSNLIAAAKTDNDIVTIEKIIGSEKTKTTLYQEFIPELIDQCDKLRPDIKIQKEHIRELQRIAEQEKQANLAGDIHQATELQAKKIDLEKTIQESGIRIHEKAFANASEIEIVAPEVVDTAPKGRSNWKWRVDDIKLLQKKMPHLVKLVADDTAIDLLLKTKKEDGSLKDKMEDNFFGIVFYNDKSYTR